MVAELGYSLLMKKKKLPLSAIVITLNAERYLGEVLDALGLCSEILVVDSGSTDSTESIAREHGVRWEQREFSGYGPQKRAATAMARHDWILSIDADEILDEECIRAIRTIDFPSVSPSTCWSIRRRPFIGRREIRHGHWVPDRVVRLFHRKHHGFSNDIVHESVHPTGRVIELPGAMRHYSYASLDELFRAEHHLLKAAQYRNRRRRIPGAFHLALRADWAFFHSLILRRGLLDGRAGVLVALSAALNATLGLALAAEEDSRTPSSGTRTDDTGGQVLSTEKSNEV